MHHAGGATGSDNRCASLLNAGELSLSDCHRELVVGQIETAVQLFETGMTRLKKYKLYLKDSLQIIKEKNNTYTLKISYRDGVKQINNIDKIFENKQGIYNQKGYYDEETVEKFNKIIYSLFDEILGFSK